MGLLRKLRRLIWRRSFPDRIERGRYATEPPQRPQICAVIVTYNIGEAIHRCFDSIHEQVGHVLIIDNGSDVATRRELDRLAASGSVTLILNERNEGVAHAYNQAVQWTRGQGFQWILTLDHDSEATPGMVEELIRGFDTLSVAGIQNTALLGTNAFDLNSQQYLSHSPGENGGLPVKDSEVISSGSLIWLGVFDVVAPFNEDLFIYFVDIDFCKRLVRSEYGAYVCPEAVLLHQEGCKRRHKFLWFDTWYEHYGTTARYYISRNTIYLMKWQSLRRSEFRVLARWLCTDHLKILLFDETRFPVLWFSLKGILDGMRGRVGRIGSGKVMKSETMRVQTWNVDWRRPLPTTNRTGVKLALYAHYSCANKVAPYVLHYLRNLRELGFRICFISNSPIPASAEQELNSLCEKIIQRENLGYDFAMWRQALETYELSEFDELLLTNSSIVGPFFPLEPLWQRASATDCDFWGMTDNPEFADHLQSYFLVLRRRVLEHPCFQSFWHSVLPFHDKTAVIVNYEIGLTKWLEQHGLKWVSLFRQNEIVAMYWDRLPFTERLKDRFGLIWPPQNTATLLPDLLLERGMPFLKVEHLRDGAECGRRVASVLRAIKTPGVPADVLEELRRQAG